MKGRRTMGLIHPAPPQTLISPRLGRLLLIEDDDGDALLVDEALREGKLQVELTMARSLAEGLGLLSTRPQCVLLDLGLPDAEGLSALQAVVTKSPGVPVIVLTGRHDRRGEDALAEGAQDYLVKDELTATLLARSVRYAIERKRAESTALQLREARLNAAENSRLGRGLLPTPLLLGATYGHVAHYRPGSGHAIVGGDFYDVVETAGGRLRAVIGDVMGHGPDEAALGVRLRVAWRTLVLAGTPDDAVLPAMSRLLKTERHDDFCFVTACDITIDADLQGMTARTAGHPPPVLIDHGRAEVLDLKVGMPLGVNGSATWPETHCVLPTGWALLLYTDGLLDSFMQDNDPASIGMDEQARSVERHCADDAPLSTWLARLLDDPSRRAVTDDLATVAITARPAEAG
jgi:serine phosphatase RsbU (regulator of sigma subunit)